MQEKLTTLDKAIATVNNGDVVALQNTALSLADTFANVVRKLEIYDRGFQDRLLVTNAPLLWQVTAQDIQKSSSNSLSNFLANLWRDLNTLISHHEGAVAPSLSASGPEF